jgi:hypothetical protein
VNPPPLDKVLEITWDNHWDEWLFHLRASLRTENGVLGDSLASREADKRLPVAHMVFTPNSTLLHSHLVIAFVPAGIVLSIEGDGTPSQDQLEPWIRAISAASERVGRSRAEFSWTATIGPDPEQGNSDAQFKALGAATTVGTLNLRPGDVHLREWRPTYPPSLVGRSLYQSWPIVVEGGSTGYSWDVASLAASRALHRLCGLLSIAWDGCWVLREGPRPREWGPVNLPETLGGSEYPQDEREPTKQVMSLPDWMQVAWESLEADQSIANAVAAHHEELQLFRKHTSFAHIAFVGAIEAIGAKLYKLDTAVTVVLRADRLSVFGKLCDASVRMKTAHLALRPSVEGIALDPRLPTRADCMERKRCLVRWHKWTCSPRIPSGALPGLQPFRCSRPAAICCATYWSQAWRC